MSQADDKSGAPDQAGELFGPLGQGENGGAGSGNEGNGDGQNEPFFGDFKTREEAETGLKQLTGELESLKKANEGLRDTFQQSQQTITRLIQTPPGQDGGSKDPLADMPDPVSDPDAHKQWLVERERKRDQEIQEIRNQTSESELQGRVERVYSEFQSEHPDLARHTHIVEGIAREEIAKMAQHGDDPRMAIVRDANGFKDKVARRANEYLKDKGYTGGDQGGDQDGNRSSGIPGGGAPSNGVAQRGLEPQSNMISEIEEMQSKSPFF